MALAVAVGPPRLTVSLVTYNGSRWLPGCLASLVDQDFSDFEVIVHDNASRDDGHRCCKPGPPIAPT